MHWVELSKLLESRVQQRTNDSRVLKYVKWLERTRILRIVNVISLVSSFFASVFAGKYAPIDLSDGSGMNLLDIHSKMWCKDALRAMYSKGKLENLLGTPAPSHSTVGPIAPYFRKRYGFSDSCDVIAWSGDNNCTLAGLGLNRPGDVAVSLGTSDTLFGITSKPKPQTAGHVFVSPVDPKSAMVMLCFMNGSLVREKIRDLCADGNWSVFDKSLKNTSPGNNGKIGIFFENPEITPKINRTGHFFFEKNSENMKQISQMSHDEQIRGVLESHFLALRLHSKIWELKLKRKLLLPVVRPRTTRSFKFCVMCLVFPSSVCLNLMQHHSEQLIVHFTL